MNPLLRLKLKSRSRRSLTVIVVMLALGAQSGRPAAQSVSLVMEEASLQRRCADEAKAVASEGPASDLPTSTSLRCRAALPKSSVDASATYAYWLLLLLLAAGLVLHLTVRRIRRGRT